MYKTVFNTTDSPALADDEGRVVGGGEWGVVDTTSDAGRAALDSGQLVEVEVNDGEDDIHPDAVSARDEAERLQKLSSTSKDDLVKAAEKAGIETDDATKDELVSELRSTRKGK